MYGDTSHAKHFVNALLHLHRDEYGIRWSVTPDHAIFAPKRPMWVQVGMGNQCADVKATTPDGDISVTWLNGPCVDYKGGLT